MKTPPTFVISTSEACQSEKDYVLRWLFEEVWGADYRLVIGPAPSTPAMWSIELAGAEGRLTLPDLFFHKASENWLSPLHLPKLPLPEVRFTGQDPVPALFGISSPAELPGATSLSLSMDVFGSLFFLISRYEEAVLDERDSHGRFPRQASIIDKAGLLDRAIGNEYIELLWKLIQTNWPQVHRRQSSFQMMPSHDIDVPSTYGAQSFGATLKNAAGDLIRRQAPATAIARIVNRMRVMAGNHAADPLDNIDWIMDQSERHGLRSAFYYIPEVTCKTRDPGIPIQCRIVEHQWSRIAQRGHEIGVHPGYETHLDVDRVIRAAQLIREQLESLNIEQPLWGGRQHYLRWTTPTTAVAWDQANLKYDSTLGFADRPGFRCGVCLEFPFYDVVARQPLRLRERPLIAMECSVTESQYMDLGYGEQAFKELAKLKDVCREHRGIFTLLWHNTLLQTPQQRELYCSILDC